MTQRSITLTLTDAGLAALAQAAGQSRDVQFQAIALGSGTAPLDHTALALTDEQERQPILAALEITPGQFRVSAQFPADVARQYAATELALICDGVVFGVWSTSDVTEALVIRTPGVPELATIVVGTAALPSQNVTVVIQPFDAAVAGVIADTMAQLAAPGDSSLCGFIQDGPGAVPRTGQDKMREWFSAADFGVIPASPDNSPAHQVLMAACQATGRDAWYPDGTYLFATTYGGNNAFIPAPSNIKLFGSGNVVFKAAPGLNASRPYGFNFIFPVERDIAHRVDNLTVKGICFDHNGSANLPANGSRPKNAAVGAVYGSNITVEDCATINNAGEQSFMFGTVDANNAPTASNIRIRRVSAHNVADAAGNAGAVDHSTIFVIANDYEIRDIDGENDVPAAVGTLVEAHGSYGSVFNLGAKNYMQLGNKCATLCDTVETIWGPNLRGKNVAMGITLWCNAGRILDARIKDAEFDSRYTTRHFFDASYNVQPGAIFTLCMEGVRHTYKGGVNVVNVPVGLKLAYCNSLTYRDCRMEGILGNAIAITAINPGGMDIHLEGNKFVRCCQTTLAPSAYNAAISIGPQDGSMINRLVIKNNDAVGSGSYLYAIQDIAVTISELIDDGNTIDSSMIAGGTIGGQNPILGAGKITIRRVDNRPAEQNVRASQGSEIIDRTTGIVWKRQATGEGRTGWIAFAYGTAVPTTGYWPAGSRVLNAAPAQGQPEGWVCVATGTAGTWRPLPNIQ